jgi:hypothetical protein
VYENGCPTVAEAVSELVICGTRQAGGIIVGNTVTELVLLPFAFEHTIVNVVIPVKFDITWVPPETLFAPVQPFEATQLVGLLFVVQDKVVVKGESPVAGFAVNVTDGEAGTGHDPPGITILSTLAERPLESVTV